MWQEGVMGGGGDDWYNVILLTATAGVTVNITDGDEDIDIVGTGLQQAVTIHDENATYTISANENGLPKLASSVTTDSTSGKLFTRELKMAAIEVTFDDDFRSQSFTISDGTTTSTAQTFPATGNTVDIFVPSTGTWKVYSTVSGESYDSAGAHVTDLDGTYTDEIHVIPVGATVTPVNDIQIWLNCAAIRNKPYTKIEEVLADEITLIKLMSDSNAVDYLKRSTDWINAGLVPVMTDNTHPTGVGECVSSMPYDNTRAAYIAFDGISVTADTWNNSYNFCPVSGQSVNDWYVGYKFDNPTVVDHVRFQGKNIKDAGSTNPIYTIALYAGNSLSNLTKIGNNITIGTNQFIDFIDGFENDTAYVYYVFKIVDSNVSLAHSVGNYAIAVTLIQFLPEYEGVPQNELAMQAIGAYDYAADTLLADSSWGPAIIESEYANEVITNTIPTMTSDTAPSGQAICAPNYQSSYPAWKAFDKDSDTAWIANNGTTSGSICYKFDNAVEISALKLREFRVNIDSASDIGKAHQITLEYSDDNVTYTPIETHNLSATDPHKEHLFVFGSSITAKYFRISYAQNNYYDGTNNTIIVSEMQLYGREAGGVQSWLKAAGISKPYTTLDEVIADSDTLATLVTNHDAVDYLVTAKGLIDGITSSPKAMRYIGYRNYCADTLLADSEWCDAIFNSEYMDSVLNTRVPYMTSDTTPEGVVSASSTYNTGYAPWYVFTPDDNVNYWTAGSTVNQWLQYEFPEDVKVYYARQRLQGTYPAKNYKYQASDDGTTFTDITDVVTTQYQTADWDIVTKVRPADVDDHKYYRLYVIDSHSSYLGVKKLQFYGRKDVDESKIHILSAASDTIKDITSGTAVTLCATDTYCKAVIARTSMPNGDYTLESTVALDPEGNMSTDLYQKEVNVTNDTVEITVMPEDALYWYGYVSENCEDIASANGWTYRTGSITAPTHNTNNTIADVTSYSISGISSNKIIKAFSKIIGVLEGLYQASNSYGYIEGYKSKTIGDDICDASTFVTTSSIAKWLNTMSQNGYAMAYSSLGSSNHRSIKIHSLFTKDHNPLANFFSAANDTVYYTVGGTDIVVAETNELGEAVVDLSSIPSGVILKSSVAKDPDDLSNDYTKLFIPPMTERFYFMPDNALYWYGWMSDECEVVSTDNGWSLSGFTTVVPNFEEDDAVLNPGASNKLSGLGFKVAAKGKGRLNLVYQGVTAYSGDYGSMYSCASKAITTSIYTTLTSSSVSKTSLDFDANTYNLVMAGHTRKANIDSLWYDAHSSLSNFFSAANDRVYYLDDSTPVYVAETNGAGEAWIDLTKIPNGVTLYSSVAKDPDNLSSPFSKVFTVGADGKFYLMPEDGDKMLYWYGYVGENLEVMSTNNGWNYSGGQVMQAPDFKENYILCDAPSNYIEGVGTKSVMNATRLCGICEGVTSRSNQSGMLRTATDKTNSTLEPAVSVDGATITKYVNTPSSSNREFMLYTQGHTSGNRAFNIYAAWLED